MNERKDIMSAVFGFGRVAPTFTYIPEYVAPVVEIDWRDALDAQLIIQDEIDHMWTQRDYDIEDANWMPDWMWENIQHDIMDEEAECWAWYRLGADYEMFHECDPLADWH